MLKTSMAAFFAGALMASAISAETWTLNNDASKLSFGSIKNDRTGEVHSFKSLSGTVSADGMVEIEIDLTSIETNIEIRNERMIEFVFGDSATATLSVGMDMAELNAIPVGGHGTVFAVGDLSFLGQTIAVESDMFVLRASEAQTLVSTDGLVFLDIEDAGLAAGIDKMMELASLPGITRTSPVTVRLMFDKD
ncbi:YceI family protein [Oceaniglobus ichthyenteri]|uniref:YceI family protein n=1 Tax=Oceaniglobus ichthyenteri TaxID=2136177 RepID=UPI000D3376CC|nr:YceI family protein [Oceaniglobus ichthyenteri]